MQEVTFSVHGQTLHGTLLRPEHLKDKNPAVLFIHGWRSNQIGYIPRAEALTKLGFVCLVFDLRGQGISEGDIETLTRKDFLDDVCHAYDFLAAQKGVDHRRIGVVGASFGGYLAALLSAKRALKWLVMRVPANYPDEGFETIPTIRYLQVPGAADWRQKVLAAHETAALQAVQAFSGSLLLIESENDAIIPHQTIANYQNAAKNNPDASYVLMKGADHSIKKEPHRSAFISLLTSWFATQLKKRN